jgi:RimJ/RimL family protein N-acetyltransferase
VPQPVLRTDRLVLVPLADDHLDLEIELDSDPEVLRYLSPRARTAEETVANHARRLRQGREVDGLGMWMAFLDDGRARDAATFVGLFMLTPTHGPSQPQLPGWADLGYRIRRDRWRQGFAREGSVALLRHGFQTARLERVIAQTMAVNAGSRAVMSSVGLSFVRSFSEDYDDPVAGHEQGEVEYAITRTQWLGRPAAVTAHNPDSLFPPYAGYPHAVEVPAGARTVYVSGLNGYEQDGTSMPPDFEGQARLVWRHLASALAASGMTYADLVQLRFYLRHADDDPANVALIREHLGAHHACRTVVVQELLEPAWLIEVEAVAARVD